MRVVVFGGLIRQLTEALFCVASELGGADLPAISGLSSIRLPVLRKLSTDIFDLLVINYYISI